ncbi:MAG: murein biosynthesis integral membrane protein MurJ [Candidatus Omnitrophica bacterium]|nr:murein biosynthesis integral membrane protein MurJ [Candidatus Omnitrophota bacterium]MBL7210285.1 murein biosynthesis integral membrane protein MurJ [Candidatus Omnitrophota bacterium]
MSTDKSYSSQADQSVARSAGVISLGILCSRLLGFLRDIVIARLFGVYMYAEAFVVAFRIPNLLRDFVGEGASNAAFVPVFSEYKLQHTKEEFWELANVVLNLLLVILMVITVLGIISAPLIVRVIAPGFTASAEKLAITIRLTRIIFPYILLISLVAYCTGILNSLRHFAVPAFSPCLLNISIIIFTLIFRQGTKGLALGVLIGGLLQLAVQIPVLYKKGFRLKLPRSYRQPAAKAIGRLMLPRLFSSCIYQLNNLVDSIFGSLAWIVGEGGVAILYFSYRVILFPLGIFSNALSQAMLPTLSTHALLDRDKLRQALSWSLRATFFVILPASAALIVLADPIVSALFGGGKFDLYSVHFTARALLFYSIGLSAYGANRMLQSCFFALKDTRTPAKVAFLALILNVIFNSILIFPLKVSGVALATSISGIITFLILFSLLKKKIGDFQEKKILISFLRILAASICMGAVCYFFSQRNMILAGSRLIKFYKLGAVMLAGLVSYAGFCFIFRVGELRELLSWLARRHK